MLKGNAALVELNLWSNGLGPEGALHLAGEPAHDMGEMWG